MSKRRAPYFVDAFKDVGSQPISEEGLAQAQAALDRMAAGDTYDDTAESIIEQLEQLAADFARLGPDNSTTEDTQWIQEISDAIRVRAWMSIPKEEWIDYTVQLLAEVQRLHGL